MDEESIGASVYAAWEAKFLGSLFSQQIKDERLRYGFASNDPFIDFVHRMLIALEKEPSRPKFNKIC